MARRYLLKVTAIALFIVFFNFLKTHFWLTETNLVSLNVRLIVLSFWCVFFVITPISIFKYRNEVKPYFKKLIAYLPLLSLMVKRDFKAKYKRSVLGILWTVLNPLFTMIIMTIVFSTLFRFNISNFPVYLLTGQVVFTFFSEATNMAMVSIVSGANLIKKINIPKYIFPLSKVLSSCVNFLLSLVALLIVMVITKSEFTANMFAVVLPISYIFFFSLGIGMILSVANVFFRDILYLYSILLTGLTYLTPIFYPIDIIPKNFRLLISLNPMYHFVECFRTVVLYNGIPNLWQNIVCASLSVISLVVGFYVFYKKQDEFVLHL